MLLISQFLSSMKKCITFCYKSYTHRYIDSTGLDTSSGDLFEYADLPTGISALFCFVFTFTSSIIKKEGISSIPIKETIILGILYTINVSTLNFALYYIPYPVKVVGDKLGYLTAVIVGVFFTRVAKNSKFKLGTEKIVIAIMITIGTLIFASFNKVITLSYRSEKIIFNSIIPTKCGKGIFSWAFQSLHRLFFLIVKLM